MRGIFHPTPEATQGRMLLGLLLLLASTGCTAPPFAYRNHERPRVSVIHRPLHPEPGEMITIIARAEPGDGATVLDISIAALVGNVGAVKNGSCENVPECTLEIASGDSPGVAIYGATTTDTDGNSGRAPAAYIFQIGTPPGEARFPLRVPFDIYAGERAFDILLVRDGESYDRDADFEHTADDLVLADAENLLYDSLLKDPAYRWRDNQLAFYFLTEPGVTTDYHSGLKNRCGQDPWYGDPIWGTVEAAVMQAEVVAVIHRNGGFRDCSSMGIVDTGAAVRGHFSAFGERAEVFHHELGHALFGLSDEYWESTLSRTPRADALKDFDDCVCDCCLDPSGITCCPGQPLCCCDPSDDDESTGEGGGGGPLGIGGGGGGPTVAIDPIVPDDDVDPCTLGLPICSDSSPSLPIECSPADLSCPPLESSCRHPNVFPSDMECMAAATFSTSALHPGLELDAPSECRLLCGPDGDDPRCPCNEAMQVWIMDRRYPPEPNGRTGNDIMGEDLELERWVGPACERCTEFVFCRKWEMGRGQSQTDAVDYCLNP